MDRLHYGSKECPHCHESLVGPEIKQENRHCYIGFEKDPDGGRWPVPKKDDGRPMFYSNIIGMSSMLFDRILAYKCPHCGALDVISGMEGEWQEECKFMAENGVTEHEEQAGDRTIG